MVDAWSYPQSVTVDGMEYEIRTDYRAVIDLLTALKDPDCEGDTEAETQYIKAMITLQIMFPHYEDIPEDKMTDAIKAVYEFIDMGLEDNKKKHRTELMDWQQDAQLIIPAVNKVLGKEIRAERYIHWWTFLSAYLEIGECNFSHVLNIRSKKAKGKKLEDWEKEYIKNNPYVLLHSKQTEEEQKEAEDFKNAIDALIGGD